MVVGMRVTEVHGVCPARTHGIPGPWDTRTERGVPPLPQPPEAPLSHSHHD